MDDLRRILQLSGIKLTEDSPAGWEGTVKAMKKHKEIDNPWALSNYMKDKGYHSHKTKSGKDKTSECADEPVEECSDKPMKDEPIESGKINEKWDTDYETPESKKGMWDGYSKSELESMRSNLSDKEERTDAESTKLKQLNFALRAKSDWGDVPD